MSAFIHHNLSTHMIQTVSLYIGNPTCNFALRWEILIVSLILLRLQLTLIQDSPLLDA